LRTENGCSWPETKQLTDHNSAGRQQPAHRLYQSVSAGTLDAVILAYWVWGYTASLGTASMALVLLLAIASR